MRAFEFPAGVRLDRSKLFDRGVGLLNRPTVRPNGARGGALPELLARYLVMARVAQVARVAILVAATQSEWPDMIDDGCKPRSAPRVASLA